jgi:hypothetical protein
MPVVITGNNTPTAGGITYGDGTTYAVTAAGTSGRPIVSGGAGAPTFRPYTLPAADGSANQVLQTDGAGALSFATVGGGFSQAQIFTGSGSFTVPASGKFKVTIIGGGGSGTCSSSVSNGTGSGGGGGAVIKWFSGATPGATATVTIGSGGAGVSIANTAGNNGGSSTFALSGFTTLTAGGGTGGFTFGGQASSPGGTASGGDIDSPGGWGSNTIDAGGSANQVGFAGSTLLAFGRSEMQNYNSTGIAGVYGTGSNGRFNSNATGAGGAGICIVEY